LSEYPTDPHAVDAQNRIARLMDERAWTTAQITSSIPAYQQYLRAEPNGAYVQWARENIASRERDAAWRNANMNVTAQSLRDFINKYPSSAEAEEARDKLQAIAGYRAELGTARSERLAERERYALAKRFGKALHQVVILEPDAKDRDYRITSAPMSEQDASVACEALQHSARPCTVVPAAS
jgi:outer membrane protein assembly factor BamD (BamD/ComL family)